MLEQGITGSAKVKARPNREKTACPAKLPHIFDYQSIGTNEENSEVQII